MTAAAKFRVQHVAPAPRGWKVRTKLSGAHRVRIAVPPQGGKGQLVEILHPAGENPCQMKNPAQLVILGNPAQSDVRYIVEIGSNAMPPAFKTKAEAKKAAAEYRRRGSKDVSVVKVGKGAKFLGRTNPAARDKGLSPMRKAARRRTAIRRQLRSMGQPLDSRGAESLRQLRAKRKKALGNPDGVAETRQAVELYRTFQGKDPQGIVTRQRSAAMRTDYTALGPLLGVGLYVPGLKIPSPDHWDEYPHLKFERDVMLASNAQGSQLYAIGGNQDCSGCLASIPEVDISKDLVDVGEIAFVVYLANKAPSFRATEYMHSFDAPRPSLGFDRIKREIFFVGGAYVVEEPGIVH